MQEISTTLTNNHIKDNDILVIPAVDINNKVSLSAYEVQSRTASSVTTNVQIDFSYNNINDKNESYILNFDYYYSQGLLNKDSAEEDRLQFISDVAALNLELQDKEKTRRDLESSMTALGSKRNVYTELVDTAKDMKTDALGDFENLTNRTYSEYQEQQSEATYYDGDLYIETEDEEVVEE